MIKIPRVCQKNFPIGWFSPPASQHAGYTSLFSYIMQVNKNARARLVPFALWSTWYSAHKHACSPFFDFSSALLFLWLSFLRRSTRSHLSLFFCFPVTEYLTHTIPLPFFHSDPNPRAANVEFGEEISHRLEQEFASSSSGDRNVKAQQILLVSLCSWNSLCDKGTNGE